MTAAKQHNVDLRANTAVLVSHNHLNHANDVNAVISSMTYNGFDKKGVIVGNDAVIHGTENSRPFLRKFYRGCLERFIVLEQSQRVGINEIEIKAIKAFHSDKTTGYKFFTPIYTLCYSSDTKYSPELIEEYKNSNILILNVPYLKKDRQHEGLSKDDAVKIINEVNPHLTVITHFGLEFLKADPLYEIRDIKKEVESQVVAATDGMQINPVSYAADKGQRTLTGLQK